MNSRLILMLVLTFCTCALVSTAPMEAQNEEETDKDIEKTYNELQDLKRVVRQCPFSGGGGGFSGGPGGAGGPDLNQMISIARTVLNMLDGGNAGGAGGFGGGGPGVDGTNPQVDNNVLGRLRGRRG
ncbi:chaperone protein DnaJ-like [Chironomus tepperi]|uniref:chaperone protein DnaJ-like n=1 Tax=Chironomus tepperi TaxID=113505 RepID=UPI00391F2B32